jgi:hypothetical protein
MRAYTQNTSNSNKIAPPESRPAAWGTVRNAHAHGGGYTTGALAYALEWRGARIIVAGRVRHVQGRRAPRGLHP